MVQLEQHEGKRLSCVCFLTRGLTELNLSCSLLLWKLVSHLVYSRNSNGPDCDSHLAELSTIVNKIMLIEFLTHNHHIQESPDSLQIILGDLFHKVPHLCTHSHNLI